MVIFCFGGSFVVSFHKEGRYTTVFLKNSKKRIVLVFLREIIAEEGPIFRKKTPYNAVDFLEQKNRDFFHTSIIMFLNSP